MKIAIFGSIAFYNEMQQTKKRLENMGHEVVLPPFEIENEEGKMISVRQYYEIRKMSSADTSWVWKRKKEVMRKYLDKIAWADAILVLNYDKNNIEGYVGSNTLIEMGVAFYLDKLIYLLNSIPEMNCKEEIFGMGPTTLDGNINKIQKI